MLSVKRWATDCRSNWLVVVLSAPVRPRPPVHNPAAHTRRVDSRRTAAVPGLHTSSPRRIAFGLTRPPAAGLPHV